MSSVTLFKRSGVWYVRIAVPGQKVRRLSTKSKDKAVATKLAAKIHEAVVGSAVLSKLGLADMSGALAAIGTASLQDMADGKDTAPQPSENDYKAFWAWYIPYAESHHRPGTVKRERLCWSSYERLGYPNAEIYIQKRQADGLKPGGINLEIRHLKAILNAGVKSHELADNPFANVKQLKVAPKAPRFLSGSESERLLTCAKAQGQDIHLFVALMLHAGLRSGEALHALWAWVNFEQKTLMVAASESWQSKDCDSRTVPMCSELLEILEPIKKTSGFIMRPDGANREFSSMRNGFSLACKSAGLTWVTPHVCRHSFASSRAQAGVSLFKIQKWLGHSSSVTTEIYSHLTAFDEDINKTNGKERE